MNEYKICSPSYEGKCREFYRILCLYNRRSELNRLVAWAKRKRLSRSLHLYKNRLEDTERILFRYRVESPRITALAYRVHQFGYFLFPQSRYPAKGSASGYKVRVSWPERSKPIVCWDRDIKQNALGRCWKHQPRANQPRWNQQRGRQSAIITIP